MERWQQPIEEDDLQHAERVLQAAFKLGSDPRQSHEFMADRTRIDMNLLDGWTMNILGTTSRALAKCDSQKERDLVLYAALRHMLATGIVAHRHATRPDQ